jgi:periplasmic copper chaperone A
MKLAAFVFTALGVMAAPAAWAGQVTVSNAWVRATAPGQEVAGAFMDIQSDANARLVSANSTLIPRVEMHEMKMDGDVMRMREVKFIKLPKGETVSLKPGGYHIMLMNLKRPIAPGDKIPLTLVIETQGKREKVQVEAVAKSPMEGSDGAMQHHMHH